MNKIISKIQYFVAVVVALVALQFTVVSCSDKPDADFIYTQTSEYANSYLSNRSDNFSKFIEIINKSRVVSFDLLGTYGEYTVFAPTNDAVDLYLAGRGMTSVDELSVEDCDTIAANHIIEKTYFTTDFSDATLPTANMLDRYLTITCDSDLVSNPGKVEIMYFVNKSSQIIIPDDSVENGVVHTMNRVIDASNEMLPDLLEKDSSITLFYQALKMTHMDDSMQLYIDDTYYCSPDSFEEGHTYYTGVEYDNVFYMEKRFFGYTGFIEKDEVYAAYGINNLDDLIQYAKQVYDEVYPECADITDPTDRRNSLNRFVSYHFLPFRCPYNMLTVDNKMLSANFDRRHWDVADWYETMAPYSIMKISYPSGSQQGRYVNRRGIQNRKDSRGVFVPGAKISTPSEAEVNQTAVNGVYHYVNDIITYGKETQEVVLNERMRMDASTLSPDFITSGARGHSVIGVGGCPDYPGQYGAQSFSSDPKENINTCLGFKAGTAKNFQYTDATHLHVRPRYMNFASYEGDEVTIQGMFDVTFKLPPVPEGNYEVRTQSCLNFPTRGIIQVYLDGEPCGIPVDVRIAGTNAKIGWRSDTDLGDDEAIMAYDKAMHNRGWMKGPASYGLTAANGDGGRSLMRDGSDQLRKVWGVFHSDGRTDHYVRVQQKLETTNGTFPFDYLELCPQSVYNNEYYPEDKY